MSADPIAWLNGRYLPLRQASLSVLDAGVTSGASVTERLRTFRHKPFLLEEHLVRLQASADAAFVRLRVPIENVRSIVNDVVLRNAASLSTGDDLSISVFATAGVDSQPTLCVHAAPLPAEQYAARHDVGVALVTPTVAAIPRDALSPQIKTRSRLHWHIADQLAQRTEVDAKALLVDHEGLVTETSTGNVFAVRGNSLLTPRRDRTLAGVSQAYVMRLAETLGYDVAETDLRVDDLLAADEAFLTSSVYCMLPVIRLNRSPVGSGEPGPTFRAILTAWSGEVGVDIANQMLRMAAERKR
jgi:branched-subunit amino acid aminotransferase/4-amino-4-deoxychorismate lyase